ncbi:MAG: sigma-54 dependent transcriptional regulator [Candidatus Poribacteria bacterium]|nr:sigma-54 dependent transcriptional regulator [Candidatus Poribacteria bacterium]
MQNGSQPIALQSPQMQQIYQQVQQAAPTKATVLITGETGVGKEIIAKDIHRTNSRSRYPFKVVNCSAFPENGLLQSELFGHEKGAFTGATAQRAGMFEQADGGTLFLDEIGEMFFGVQAMLLRVLEHQPFTRIGGNKNVKVDVRIIAATNRDLRAAVKNGTFRQDLYYRLNSFHIHIPPLRERREDIAPLVHAFISELSAAHQKRVTGITSAALYYLEAAAWQGNIRQLKNVINRAILTTQTEELGVGDIPADIALTSPSTKTASSESGQQNVQSTLPIEVRKILERLSVVEFISIFGGIPVNVWQRLPAQTQNSVIREASFKLGECLGSLQDTIDIAGKDRQQILTAVAQQRFEKYGNYTQTAETLGIDRRTLKTYLENDDDSG